MIRNLTFRNFKGLRNVDLTLERFTVLVGPNASGKSSVLEGLHWLSRVSTGSGRPLFEFSQDRQSLYSRGGDTPLLLIAEADDGSIRLRAEPQEPGPNTSAPSSPSRHQEELPAVEVKTPEGVWQPLKEGVEVSRSIRLSALLRLDLAHLSGPSYSETPVPTVGSTGEGLPSVLAHMALNRPDDFRQLQEHLKRVVPAFQRLRFVRAPVRRGSDMIFTSTIQGEGQSQMLPREYMGEGLLFDMQGASSIPGQMASGGTLLVLGLLGVLLGPAERPKLALLDDVDHGLHPKAQQELVGLIRTLLELDPELQIVATTHSPYFLDRLKPEEVRLTYLLSGGSVACGRLEDHPQFDKWKDEMTPGEFWSLVGEKWVSEQVLSGK